MCMKVLNIVSGLMLYICSLGISQVVLTNLKHIKCSQMN